MSHNSTFVISAPISVLRLVGFFATYMNLIKYQPVSHSPNDSATKPPGFFSMTCRIGDNVELQNDISKNP